MTTVEAKFNNETIIRRQIDNFVKAFRAKDVNLMMSLYAPGIVSFDIVPPLRDVGKDIYRKVWEKTFASFRDPIDIEIRDVSITAGDDLAFSHNLLGLHATTMGGRKIDFWESLTLCFSKTDGQWLITHEHVSVPADLEHGKAVLDLEP